MKISSSSLLLLVGSATASPTWAPWPSSSPSPPSKQAKALYVQTDDLTGNAIIAMKIGSDGSLSGGQSYATGGIGSNLITPSTGQPLFPDPLSVQDSIVTTGEYLFVVNAGSNTVSMFAISPDDPTILTLLGSPQSSNGFFPVALAVADDMKIVCVSNTGVPSGTACGTYGSDGLSPFDALREMYEGQYTNPPLAPTPGTGDLFFSADHSKLVLMVKGNGTDFTGYAATYAVVNGKVSDTATVATPPGSGALFGSALFPGSTSKILTSDATIGGLILDLDNLAGEPLAVINVTGQVASCWAEISTFTGTGFITDVAVNRLVEVSLQDGSIIDEYYPPNPNLGMSDFAIMGTKLWALSGNNGTFPPTITTFDLSGGPQSVKQISTYYIPGTGVNTQGMVVI